MWSRNCSSVHCNMRSNDVLGRPGGAALRIYPLKADNSAKGVKYYNGKVL